MISNRFQIVCCYSIDGLIGEGMLSKLMTFLGTNFGSWMLHSKWLIENLWGTCPPLFPVKVEPLIGFENSHTFCVFCHPTFKLNPMTWWNVLLILCWIHVSNDLYQTKSTHTQRHTMKKTQTHPPTHKHCEHTLWMHTTHIACTHAQTHTHTHTHICFSSLHLALRQI